MHPYGAYKVYDSLGYSLTEGYDVDGDPWWTCEHIARWDPARTLAEIRAKRAILENYQIVAANNEIEKARRGDEVEIAVRDVIAKSLLMVLRRLAAPYADHPDYDQVWRIDA